MGQGRSSILIIDDDPVHLEIYGQVIQHGGYDPRPLLAVSKGFQVPSNAKFDLVLLDYRLNSLRTSTEIAMEIRASYPSVPVLLLSDIWALPDDIAPFVTAFVRKGEPAKLLEAISALLVKANPPPLSNPLPRFS